jgi:hypothetical protein
MTITRSISAGLALTLALAAGAAPASARPFDLNAHGSFVPAGSTSMQTPNQPIGTPPILSAPPPSQRTALPEAHQRELLAYLAYHQPRNAKYSNAEMNAYVPGTSTGIPSTVVHVASTDGRFDWGDAGIGAAGTLVLVLVGGGGAFAISQQRQTRRSKRSPAITG